MHPLRALAITAVVVCAATVAAVALAASSFSDPTGDNNAAPDVTSVTVSESEGTLTVTVVVANYQALPRSSWLNVWFDLDSNPATGDAGDEAVIRYLDDGGLEFFRWNGSSLVRQLTTGMAGTFTAGALTLTAPRATLGDVPSFGVLVVGSRGQDVGGGDQLIASDFAPNRGRGQYTGLSPATVVDAAGDHDSAPDVTKVDVRDTRAGLLEFTIATPSHATLPEDTWVELDVDVDRRRGTGDAGVEVFIGYARGRVVVGRWDARAGEFVPVGRAGVRVRSGGGAVTIAVPRKLLDDVASFAFYVVTGDSDAQEDVENAVDIAPDGSAWWRYALQYTPPLRLIADPALGVPARPRAGSAFTVVVPIRRSDTARGITSGAVACNVTVQGRRVRSTGSVGAGAGRCSLGVPAGARGAVRGSMVVRSGGRAVTARFSFAIR